MLIFAGEPIRAVEKPGAPGTNVEMPFLIAPLTVDGKLFGYAYISTKVVTNSRNGSLAVRDRIPYIQDAFVRDVNRTPISKSGDSKTVDKAALIARLTADVKNIVGAAMISSVVLIKIQVAPLHPTEAPALNASATPPG
jgi:hypothetical protein